MSYLLIFFTLSVLILLHEFGHLLAAKCLKIPVARFSIGFGPKLWSFTRGGTEYRLAVIPIGGYVLPRDENAFDSLPLTKNLIFSVGGPLANLLGAVACISVVSVALNGLSLNTALSLPLVKTWQDTEMILALIPTFFSQTDKLSGVVGIVATGGQQVGTDWLRLLGFAYILNLNLAILNLLPLPPLDGGRMIMALLQKIYAPLRKLYLPLAVTGWVLLLGLMTYVTILDTMKLVGGS